MAYDTQYGHVTLERGDVGDDEMVIVFRGRNDRLVPMLDCYFMLCRDAGHPQAHLDAIIARRRQFAEWQAAHGVGASVSEPG
jgi:hypothetical protein